MSGDREAVEAARDLAAQAAMLYDEVLDDVAASPVGHPVRRLHSALGDLAHAALATPAPANDDAAAAAALAEAVLAVHRPYNGPNEYVGCMGKSCWPGTNRTTPWPCTLARLAQAALATPALANDDAAASVERVRALADGWVGFDDSHHYGDAVLMALGPAALAPPVPTDTEGES